MQGAGLRTAVGCIRRAERDVPEPIAVDVPDATEGRAQMGADGPAECGPAIDGDHGVDDDGVFRSRVVHDDVEAVRREVEVGRQRAPPLVPRHKAGVAQRRATGGQEDLVVAYEGPIWGVEEEAEGPAAVGRRIDGEGVVPPVFAR